MADAPYIPDVADLTIERIRQGLEDGEFTCQELCEVSDTWSTVSFRFTWVRLLNWTGVSGQDRRGQRRPTRRDTDKSGREGHRRLTRCGL